MKKIISFLVITFFLSSLPFYASAGIYRFVDEEGILHFVDIYDAIPEKYRGKESEKVKKDDTIGAKLSEPVTTELAEKSESAKEQEEIKTEAEIIEEWNKKASEYRDKLEKAKSKLDEAERFKIRTTSSYSRKQYSNADRKAAQQAYEEAKKEVENSQKEWDEFGEKAKSEAPYSWWRENFFK